MSQAPASIPPADGKTAPKPRKLRRQRRPGEPNRAQRRALEKGVRCIRRNTKIPHGVMRTATPSHLLAVAIRLGYNLDLSTRRSGHGRAPHPLYAIWRKPLDLAASIGVPLVAA